MGDQHLRGQAVVLFMSAILAEFRDRGIITDGITATPKGIAIFDQLKATGFVPMPEERRTFLGDVCHFEGEELSTMEKLVDCYLDGTFDAKWERFRDGK